MEIRLVGLGRMGLNMVTRFRSRAADPFGDRLLAALRNQFGGHAGRRRE